MQLKNPRTYGKPPFTVVLVHGGPGAGGEMAPVARELASERGILEPIQTKASLAGQIEELRGAIETAGSLPVTVVGFSWGAWLGLLCAARYPELVKKLILVSSGPYEARYASQILQTRLERLSEDDKAELVKAMDLLNSPSAGDKDAAFARFGAIFTRADAYDPISGESEAVHHSYAIYRGVWKDAENLRKSGELLELAKQVRCPVVALHGDYDPHPAEGVCTPLSAVVPDFRFILLEKCGHMPWIERQARQSFYTVLRHELSGD